jgi:hypothetical protein
MIIVNFSTKEYSRGQQRLANSLNGHKKLMLNDYTAIGSPTHQESPYEFKVHAIEAAAKYDPVVLWMDSSMYVRGDLSKIENIILKDGYFMEEAGHYVNTWCNEHCRKVLDYNWQGDESNYLMFSAGLLGLNMDNDTASLWFEQWKESAQLGCFKGDWKDHRHDMTAGSILAQRLNMKYQRGGSHLSYIGPGYSQPEPGSVVYCQGV